MEQGLPPSIDPRLEISVVAGSDRQSQREQITQVLSRAALKQQPLRIRIPFTLFSYDDNRGYIAVRDATWNLQLPSDQVTPETVEELIRMIGVCMVAIAEQGTAQVEARLKGEGR